MSMYVRVKRRKQTYFLHCEPTDQLVVLKNRLCKLTNIPSDDMRLYLEKDEPLQESMTLQESKVNSDDILFLVFKSKHSTDTAQNDSSSKKSVIMDDDNEDDSNEKFVPNDHSQWEPIQIADYDTVIKELENEVPPQEHDQNEEEEEDDAEI